MSEEKREIAGADLRPHIHFALKPAERWDPYHEQNRLQERGTSGGGSPLKWYLLAAFMYVGVTVGAGAGMGTAPLVMTLIVLAGVVHAVMRRRDFLRSWRTDEFPERSDTRYRLRVVGHPRLLRALAADTEGGEVSFEPVIFRAARVHESGLRTLAKTVVILLILIVILVVGVGFSSERSYGGFFVIWTYIFTCGLVGSVLWGVLWPTYIRVVPGRMDLLQYPFLGRGKPRARSIDLMSARVLVRAPGNVLVVHPGEESGEWVCASRMFGARGLQFERAVLSAARATEVAPALPDDALIG